MTGQDLYQRLTEICRQMAQGDYEQAKAVFDLLPSDDVDDPVNVLVEAFSMMLVRTEAREFELSRLLAELEEARAELLRHQDHLVSENTKLRGELKRKASKEKKFMHLSQSTSMQAVMQQVERAAAVDCTLLFTGETGTGKSVFARHIHSLSSRSSKPFVTINCAAIPASLLESELFGIEEGVASGVKARMGRFEQAGGGTIFLDEIGDMPMESQAKLLHVVENGFVERIGGRKPIPIDVRIMAATYRDLEVCVQERTFREDLFYRLNVMHVHIPPLRERREDIPLLVKHIYGQYAQQNPLAVTQVSREAMALMTQYAWPGNVRELSNELERASLLTMGKSIAPEDLSFFGVAGMAGTSALHGASQTAEIDEGRTLGSMVDMGGVGGMSDAIGVGGVGHAVGAVPISSDQEAVAASLVVSLPQVHTVTPDMVISSLHIPTLQEVENAYISQVMLFLKENKSRTAKALGISREGLRVKLERMKR